MFWKITLPMVSPMLLVNVFYTIIDYLTRDNKAAKFIYKVVFVLVCIVGATGSGKLMWSISDTLNGMMAIPNLIALLALSGVVAKETRRYFSGNRLS